MNSNERLDDPFYPGTPYDRGTTRRSGSHGWLARSIWYPAAVLIGGAALLSSSMFREDSLLAQKAGLTSSPAAPVVELDTVRRHIGDLVIANARLESAARIHQAAADKNANASAADAARSILAVRDRNAAEIVEVTWLANRLTDLAQRDRPRSCPAAMRHRGTHASAWSQH